MEPDELSIRVDLDSQRLTLVRGDEVVAAYPVSSSQFGVGSEEGSLRTPLGRFRICEKFGHGSEVGTVFRGRRPTGEVAQQGGDEDLVLTRILWLDGVDEENRNSRDRYIYIHGTNQEEKIGQPASHGCIRMNGNDIVRLFDQVKEGTMVEIG